MGSGGLVADNEKAAPEQQGGYGHDTHHQAQKAPDDNER
jgi:hypothetical protein